MSHVDRINRWIDQGVLKAKLEKDGAFFCFYMFGKSIEKEMFTINGKSVIKGSVEEDDPKEMKHEIEDLKKQGWTNLVS